MMYHDRITLTLASVTATALGVAAMGTPAVVAEVWASVKRMSAYKTMMTFQQGEVIGLEIEMRKHGITFNGLVWKGHTLAISSLDDTDARVLKINAYYQVDDPAIA